jgi:hypothetical protein
MMLLRLANSVGGKFCAPATPDGIQQVSGLCRLGLLWQEGEALFLTELGRRALVLTASVPDGRMGSLAPEDLRDS